MKKINYPADNVIAFLVAVDESDVDAMRRFFNQEPDLFRKIRERNDWVVCDAARYSSPETVRALLDLGADINQQDYSGDTGLCCAVTKDRYEMAKFFLECGADVNLSSPLFNVACQNLQDRVAMAKLLLDHGADVNQPFLVEGLPPRNVLSEAMARGHTELVKFLKSRGAELPAPASEGGKRRHVEWPAEGQYTKALLAHFRKHYGKPEPWVLRDIVPISSHPVVVYHIPPSGRRPERVLFTAGLSSFAMNVPKGSEAYRRAELMLMLPETWPAPPEAIKNRKWAWPIQWLRKIAAYVQDNNTWLGAEVTVLCEEDPPKPLGPGTKFTAWLLASPRSKESVVRCMDAPRIQLYHLYPLYTEEYLFEREHGAEALLKQMARHNVPEYIDLTRPSVVAGGES